MTTASSIVPAMMLPFALFMLVSGAIAASLGRKQLLVTGFIGMALGSLLISLAPNFNVAFTGRVLQGLSAAFVLPSLIAFIGDHVEKKTRGKVMGAFMVFITLGTALGPAIGGWLGEFGGIKLVFFVLFMASLLMAIYYQLSLQHSPRGVLNIAKIFGDIRIASTSRGILGIGFVSGFIFIALIGTMTFSASMLAWQPFNMKAGAIGAILSLGLGGGILGAIIGGIIVDSRGRSAGCFTGLIAMLVGGGVMITTAMWPEKVGISGFLVGLPLMGFGHAISMTALETLSVEILPEHRDAATSLFNALRFSCYAIAPVLGAYFYKQAGQVVTYSLLTTFLVAGIFLFYLLSSGGLDSDSDTKTEYV